MDDINIFREGEILLTLQKFLSAHKDSYFIIGGHAAAYNLKLQGLNFRVTRDYDVVIVSEVENNEFAEDLSDLLESGGYRFAFKGSSNKRIAYRFENPASGSYPEIIEFFVKEGTNVQSLDNRFAKLNIVVDDSRISAMVLNGDIYDFARNHVIAINDLMFADKACLIALKSYAYHENEKLYKEGKVDANDYKKHGRDILRIIGSFTEGETKVIPDLPEILKDSMIKITPTLIKSKERLKQYGLSKKNVLSVINSLLGM